MQDLIIYLLKSAGLISLFYIGYYFLLKNDTGFKSNRIFLLVGIFASLLLPSLEITRTIEVESSATPFFPENFSTEVFTSPVVQPEITDWWQIAGMIYLIGLGFFLLKFLLELFFLLKLIFTHKAIRKGDYYLIQKSGNTLPFSFFNYVILDPEQHSQTELEMILKHERSHVRQWHSIDQLLTSLCVYLLWFNPLAWLYRKSVVQNLEYMADKEVMATQVSKKEYQKTLLKISVAKFKPALTNQFYQSFIKKRIMMLNKNTSSKNPFLKASLILPFIFLFLITFNVKTIAQVKEQELAQVSYKYESGKHQAIITKDAKTEELEKLEKDFNENGVVLDFTEVKRSAEGTITAIAISYNDETTGNSGSYNQSEPEGIAAFAIIIDKEKVSFRSNFESYSPKHERGSALLSKIGEKPLIVVSGKEYKKDDLNGKNIWIKNGLQVLNALEGSKKYGSKAKDGVLVISEGEIIEDYDTHLKEIDREDKNINREYFWIKEDQMPFFVTLEKREDGKPEVEKIIPDAEEIIAIQYDNNTTRIYTQQNGPLFILEGKIQEEDFDISSLDPKTIKSYTVIKTKNAIKKYGKRADKGAVEIDLKSAEEMENSSDEPEEPKKLNEGDAKIYFLTGSIKFEGDKTTKLSVRDVGSADPDALNRLYIVNGKVMDQDFDPKTISDNEIESITVLKGDNATAKYGDKASNGAIEIITIKQ